MYWFVLCTVIQCPILYIRKITSGQGCLCSSRSNGAFFDHSFNLGIGWSIKQQAQHLWISSFNKDLKLIDIINTCV